MQLVTDFSVLYKFALVKSVRERVKKSLNHAEIVTGVVMLRKARKSPWIFQRAQILVVT